MAITYASGTPGVITIDDGTYTWEDVKTADDTGGWGEITELGAYMSRCAAKVKVGSGTNTTTLTLRFQAIQFDEQVEFDDNATLEFGNLSTTGSLPYQSTMIFLKSTETYAILPTGGTSCQLNIYAAKFVVLGTGENHIGHPSRTYQTDFYRFTVGRRPASSTLGSVYPGVNGTINDFMNMNAQTGLEIQQSATGLFDDVVLHHLAVGILIISQTATVKRFRAGSNTTDIQLQGTNPKLFAVDSDITDSLVDHDVSSAETHKQNSVNLVIVDDTETEISGARVWVYDSAATPVLHGSETTNASGVHTEIYATYEILSGIGKPPATTTSVSPVKIRAIRYGYSAFEAQTGLGGPVAQTVILDDNPFITETTEATVAAYTGITISHVSESITITSNHTLEQIYDYCQYESQQNPGDFTAIIETDDGINFRCFYDFIINTGVTVTADDYTVICQNSATYTINGTGQFTGIIGDQDKRRVPITINNVVVGSRVYAKRQLDNDEALNETASGTSVTGYYEWNEES